MENRPPEIARYLDRLEKALVPLPPADRSDVLGELAAHFADGLSAGVAPEALITRMGDPDAVAQALVAERQNAADKKRSPRDLAKLVARAIALPFLVVTAAFIALNVLNLLYIYAQLIAHSGVGVFTVAKLLALNLPAVLVVTLPVAMLFSGAAGIPVLARALGRPMFRKILPRFCLAVLVSGLVISGVGVLLTDAWVAQANRGVVELVSREMLHRDTSSGTLSPQEQTLAQLAHTIRLRYHEYYRLRDTLAQGRTDAAAVDAKLNDVHKLETQYHLKVALPFLSLALAAIGCSLGILLARIRTWPEGTAAVLGIGIVTGIVTYVLLAIGQAIGPAFGTPVLGAWFPDIVLLAVAALLAVAENRRQEGADVQA